MLKQENSENKLFSDKQTFLKGSKIVTNRKII